MNIFILDLDPKKCAEYHVDKHCVKMILELAQILSTAHRVIDGVEEVTIQNGRKIKRWYLYGARENLLYRSTHVNHPCAVWTRETDSNYHWTWQLLKYLCEEYTFRYGRVHKVQSSGLLDMLLNKPIDIREAPMTPFALAMPDQYKSYDPVQSYWSYVCHEKSSMLTWKKREIPPAAKIFLLKEK